jgi:RNA polymerase sigma-70 factor (ECF subfamily)
MIIKMAERARERTHIIPSLSNAAEKSDAALIEDLAAGDKAALRLLYSRHSAASVFRFAVGSLHNRAAAEDVVGDVFFYVWNNADKFDPGSSVTTWLLAIARQKVTEALARQSTQQMNTDPPPLIHDAAECRQIPDQQDAGRDLRSALTHLPRTHREILDLVYYHGQSIQEVALILGVAPAIIRARMCRAREYLAKLLATSSSFGFDSASGVLATPGVRSTGQLRPYWT